jgi:hypothetical protein
MNTGFFSLEQMAAIYEVEQDWLFEKFLGKLNAHEHLILSADQGWGLQEYVRELGFQLTENNPDIHICYLDIKSAHSPTAFLELLFATLSQRFPEVTSRRKIDSSSMDPLQLPEIIARRRKIRVAVFIANAHLLHRFRDPIPFLRMLKVKFKNLKSCIFCIYGNSNPYFRDLVQYPGPLSGLGRVFELRHNPMKHRSASIRKLFHDHDKNIGCTNSIYMSHVVDNHPFYLKLLAWHALIRTSHTCTKAIIEKALNDLILHFDYEFRKITDRLTPKQLSFLYALMQGNQKLYSGATRIEYKLGSTSNVARIVLCLERKEIIQTGNMGTGFTNPVFREWLRRHYTVSLQLKSAERT